MEHSKSLLIISTVILLFYANGTSSRSAAPVPGTPEPDVAPTTKSSKTLLTNYIPVTMQLLSYCTEMIQYEQIGPTSTTIRPTVGANLTTTVQTTTTTTSPTETTTASTTILADETTTTTTTTTTTAKPTTAKTTTPFTTTTSTPTTVHPPGNFGPAKPPPTPVDTVVSSTEAHLNAETTESLLWNDKQFFEWFLQNKYRRINLDDDYNLQILDPLPQQLLQDIQNERYELPTLLVEDNVNEFRRIYDDKYPGNRKNNIQQNNRGAPGKKKIPPTKAYIHMLMLYDLLKREAKKLMLNKYEGFSAEIINELNDNHPESAQKQLQFALTRLLERKDIDKSDVITRTQSMIKELENPSSIISMALRPIPPLSFLP